VKTHIVLLSGGSGSRLWPLSSNARPKQFLKVLRDDDGSHVSMVQRTYAKVCSTIPNADITIVTSAKQAGLLAEQVEGDYALAIEPERRDTAPAIMLACAHLRWSQHASLDEPVVVLPIDSLVDTSYYERLKSVSDAVVEDAADLVLMGVEPTCPSKKFGYIVPRDEKDSPRMVERFVEKPEEAVAERLIERGALWNCGVFAFRLSYVLGILGDYGNFTTYRGLRSHYGELPKNSFDYEVVEKADSIAVVPYSGMWKDLGTWNTLTQEMDEQASGWTVVDDAEGTHVINELDVPVLVSGIRDAVVVATSDGILVSSKENSTNLKELVGRIDGASRNQ
jgi:mannose-1-phosphate guanylyltransferase